MSPKGLCVHVLIDKNTLGEDSKTSAAFQNTHHACTKRLLQEVSMLSISHRTQQQTITVQQGPSRNYLSISRHLFNMPLPKHKVIRPYLTMSGKSPLGTVSISRHPAHSTMPSDHTVNLFSFKLLYLGVKCITGQLV